MVAAENVDDGTIRRQAGAAEPVDALDVPVDVYSTGHDVSQRTGSFLDSLQYCQNSFTVPDSGWGGLRRGGEAAQENGKDKKYVDLISSAERKSTDDVGADIVITDTPTTATARLACLIGSLLSVAVRTVDWRWIFSSSSDIQVEHPKVESIRLLL